MKVAIAGASGVVGHALLKEILNCPEIDEIYTVGRSPSRLSDPRLKFIKSNFESFPNFPKHIDMAFCSVGTTIKKAGTKARFYEVDVSFQEAFATQCRQSHASLFALVSSMGANSKAMFHYPRCKGIAEEKIGNLQFDTYNIYRPSLLIGQRSEKRLAEDLGKFMFKLFEHSKISNKLGTRVDVLAKFILHTCLHTRAQGTHIYDAESIQAEEI